MTMSSQQFKRWEFPNAMVVYRNAPCSVISIAIPKILLRGTTSAAKLAPDLRVALSRTLRIGESVVDTTAHMPARPLAVSAIYWVEIRQNG
jgi:hypothetical protein